MTLTHLLLPQKENLNLRLFWQHFQIFLSKEFMEVKATSSLATPNQYHQRMDQT